MNDNNKKLSGKIAVITGGSSGTRICLGLDPSPSPPKG